MPKQLSQKLALRVPKHGKGKLLNGRGIGHPGAGGRPPDEFKRICQGLASGAATLAAVQRILKDPDHAAYLGALKWATEHGYGKPTQPVEHTGKDGGPVRVKLILGQRDNGD